MIYGFIQKYRKYLIKHKNQLNIFIMNLKIKTIKIGYIGLSHLGINTAVTTAELGYDVICYDQNINVIISVLYFNSFILSNNKKIFKNYFQIYLKSNIKDLIQRDSKKVYSKNLKKRKPFLVGIDIKWNEPKKSNLIIKDFFNKKINSTSNSIFNKIRKKLI